MVFSNEVSATRFLQFDLQWLDTEIARVQALIREVKAQGQESTEQSSESWHDNYNFEESQRQLRMLMNHLGGLSKARERAEIVEAVDDPVVVDVGVTVSFKDHSSGQSDTFSIGSYMVSDALRDLDFISYETPVAAALLGLAVGERRAASVGGRDREYEVLALESSESLIRSAMRMLEDAARAHSDGAEDASALLLPTQGAGSSD